MNQFKYFLMMAIDKIDAGDELSMRYTNSS